MKYIEKDIIIIILLAALTVLTYNDIFFAQHEFLLTWDDAEYVVNNDAIKSVSFHNIGLAFSNQYGGNYAPLHIISYMFDYLIFGLYSKGFLTINLLVHLCNGLLFYYLLQRLSHSKLVNSIATFIFLCHPVQVESVAWISQRKNLLAMLFFLTSWHTYINFRERKQIAKSKNYTLSLITFVASLLTKAVAVIMPPILLLFDYCYPSRHKTSSWKTHLPYWCAALVIGILTIIIQDPQYAGGRTGYYGGNPFSTALTMLPILPRYVSLVLCPIGLSAEYDFPIKTAFDFEVLLGFLAMCLLLTGYFLFYRKNKSIFFWSTVFIVGIAPIAGFIPLVTQMNERYLYFPLLGASVCISTGLVKAYELMTVRIKYKLICLSIFLPLLILPILSYGRTKVWRDSISLWSDAVTKYPRNSDAWTSLGYAYLDKGMQDNAIYSFKQTISLMPQNPFALEELGHIYLLKKDYSKSLYYLIQLSAMHPKYTKGLLLLANNYNLSGFPDKAREVLIKILALEPDNSEAIKFMEELNSKSIRKLVEE